MLYLKWINNLILYEEALMRILPPFFAIGWANQKTQRKAFMSMRDKKATIIAFCKT